MVKTSAELSAEFKGKLFALLREYDVEMQVEEESSGYSSMATGVNFFSYAEYDRENGDLIRESIDFTVGTWEDGKEEIK